MKTNILRAGIFLLFTTMFSNLGCSSMWLYTHMKKEDVLSPKYSLVTEDMEKHIRNRLEEFYLPGTSTGSSEKVYKYDTLLKVEEDARNSFISELVTYSDLRFREWRVAMKLLIDTKSASLGATSIALSAAGGLVPSPLSNILSGSSAAVQGFDKLLNSVVLHDNTLESIMNSIEIARKRKLTLIEIKKCQDMKEYTVANSFQDVVEYDNLITLDVGINELSTIASKKLSDESAIYNAVAIAKGYNGKFEAFTLATANKIKNDAGSESEAKAVIADNSAKAAEKAEKDAAKAVEDAEKAKEKAKQAQGAADKAVAENAADAAAKTEAAKAAKEDAAKAQTKVTETAEDAKAARVKATKDAQDYADAASAVAAKATEDAKAAKAKEGVK